MNGFRSRHIAGSASGVLTGVADDKKADARGFSSGKQAVLRKHPIFCDLEPAALDQLCRYAKHTTLKRGTTIVSRGDPANSLIAVISGTVKISVSSADGRTAILNLIGPGEIFGEVAVLDGQARTADATANTNCEIYVIDRRDFIPFVKSQQEISEMVGMTRESINKQLRAWAARKLVRLEHGAIVVLNAEMLRQLAEAGSGDEAD
jgi:CRP-like cAMP-binding protein